MVCMLSYGELGLRSRVNEEAEGRIIRNSFQTSRYNKTKYLYDIFIDSIPCRCWMNSWLCLAKTFISENFSFLFPAWFDYVTFTRFWVCGELGEKKRINIPGGSDDVTGRYSFLFSFQQLSNASHVTTLGVGTALCDDASPGDGGWGWCCWVHGERGAQIDTLIWNPQFTFRSLRIYLQMFVCMYVPFTWWSVDTTSSFNVCHNVYGNNPLYIFIYHIMMAYV